MSDYISVHQSLAIPKRFYLPWSASITWMTSFQQQSLTLPHFSSSQSTQWLDLTSSAVNQLNDFTSLHQQSTDSVTLPHFISSQSTQWLYLTSSAVNRLNDFTSLHQQSIDSMTLPHFISSQSTQWLYLTSSAVFTSPKWPHFTSTSIHINKNLHQQWDAECPYLGPAAQFDARVTADQPVTLLLQRLTQHGRDHLPHLPITQLFFRLPSGHLQQVHPTVAPSSK